MYYQGGHYYYSPQGTCVQPSTAASIYPLPNPSPVPVQQQWQYQTVDQFGFVSDQPNLQLWQLHPSNQNPHVKWHQHSNPSWISHQQDYQSMTQEAFPTWNDSFTSTGQSGAPDYTHCESGPNNPIGNGFSLPNSSNSYAQQGACQTNWSTNPQSQYQQHHFQTHQAYPKQQQQVDQAIVSSQQANNFQESMEILTPNHVTQRQMPITNVFATAPSNNETVLLNQASVPVNHATKQSVTSADDGDTSDNETSETESDSTSQTLQSSIQSSFKNQQDLSVSDTNNYNKRPFPCPKCPYRAKRKYHLKRHLNKYHNKMSEQITETTTGTDQQTPGPSRNKLSDLAPILMMKSRNVEAKSLGKDSNIDTTDQITTESNEKKEPKTSPPSSIPAVKSLNETVVPDVNKDNVEIHDSDFSCQLCPYTTNYERRFKAHLKAHRAKTMLSCEYCHFKCIKKSYMTRHILQMHPDTSDSSYTIVKNQEEEKPLGCPKCSYRTNDQWRLSRHMATHNHKFRCSKCPFGTNQLRKFNDHVKAHSADTVLCCNHCHFKNASNRNMINHLSNVHPGVKDPSYTTIIKNKETGINNISSCSSVQVRNVVNDRQTLIPSPAVESVVPVAPVPLSLAASEKEPLSEG